MSQKILRAVIPAAGLGTRLLPATKSQPKEMLPIVDRPAIQYVVEEAISSGIEDVLIITGRGKRSLEDHFDYSIELESVLAAKDADHVIDALRKIAEGADIFFIRQKEPKGLGHAVNCAHKHIGNEPFAVMLGDDIFLSEPPALQQMIELYQRQPGIIIAIQEVPADQTSLYGIVSGEALTQDVFQVSDLIEKPDADKAPSNLAIVGRYIFPPEIFQALQQTTAGSGGEIQLTDAIRKLRGEVPIYGYRFLGKRYDIGSRLSYLTTNIELALQRPELRDDLLVFLKDLIGEKLPTSLT
ncbi:MAG: UTP--glucose-1-phosphate uridylyltransferase GalU [Actinomycetia bacterium]|nr:UTP--glucose-1-phosphate uridylyltransferase GalU [Actinomycetes bacterium]